MNILFSPSKIKKLEIKNRFVRSATSMNGKLMNTNQNVSPVINVLRLFIEEISFIVYKTNRGR